MLRKKQDLPSPKSSAIPKNLIGGAYTGTTVSVWKRDEKFGKRQNCRP
jgi:hypothetical protein